jgi:hypothetical protein
VAGNDEVLDAVVGLLGENAAADELVLGRVGAPIDDPLGVGVADAGESFDLVGGGGVDVEQICSSSGGCGGLSGLRGLGDGEDGCGEQQDGSEELMAKVWHDWSPWD